MEVILLERIENLGQMGDVVKVRPGFARNYCCRKARRSDPTRRTSPFSSSSARNSKRTI